MRFPVPKRRLRPLVFPVLFLLLPAALPGGTQTNRATDERPVGTKSVMLTMQQWHALQEEARAAMEAPRGEQRVTRCEAFVREHPDYPGLRQVIQVLIEAYVDTRKFDPAELAALIERLSHSESLYGASRPEYLVDRYYFEHHLPLESAERLLRESRAGIAAERQALKKEKDPKRREEAQSRLAMREATVDLDEGRVLLAREQYGAAIEMLLKAESAGTRSGQNGVSVQDAAGKTARPFLAGSGSADWLNLSLARAYARTGNRQEGIRRLEQVRDFLPDYFPEIGSASAALRQELSLPAPTPREVRAEARPAADFKLKDLDGKDVSLADFKDRVVLAMFWATW